MFTSSFCHTLTVHLAWSLKKYEVRSTKYETKKQKLVHSSSFALPTSLFALRSHAYSALCVVAEVSVV